MDAQLTVHKTIKEEIVEDILSGVFQQGDLIPTQTEYAEKYGVSRIIVRKAINDLVAKGVLVTIKGRGTYVGQVMAGQFNFRRFGGLSESLENKRAVTSQLIKISRETASKKVMRYLALEDGEAVVTIERLRLLNGSPISHEKAHISHSLVASINFEEADLANNSLYKLLEKRLGLVSIYTDEQFRAVLCPQELSSHLGLEETDPVVYIKRLAYTTNQRPMEYSEIYQRTDFVDIRIQSLEP